MLHNSEGTALQYRGVVCSLCHNEEPEERSRRSSHSGSDNWTLVAYIQKEGGTRSLQLLNLKTRLLMLSDQLSVSLSTCYLSGRYNGIVDLLSCGKPLPEWHLLPVATEAVFARWGLPEVDWFASADAKSSSRYVTLVWRVGAAEFCNPFCRPWEFKLEWIFSTFQCATPSTLSPEQVEGNTHGWINYFLPPIAMVTKMYSSDNLSIFLWNSMKKSLGHLGTE